MIRKPTTVITIAVALFIFSGTVVLERCKPKEAKTNLAASGNNEFVGDQSCKSCHKNEYHEWLQSDHFLAMQPPNDSTVKGDFNNTHFTGDGVSSHFFKKDGKFFINTEGDDGKNHDYEVKYTFGYKPLQQYLVEFPGGRMQVPRVSWDTKQKKWFNQYTGQKIPAHDWLHWTGNAQNWNTMCASCHSTNLQKNYNTEADSYHTTFSVINVSCESCHGAGKLHTDYVNGTDYKNGNKIAGSYLALVKNSGQTEQIKTCAPCHARKSELSASMIESNELLDNFIPEIPTTEHFYADGQVNDEDYIYTSFLQSKMFRHGIKCSDCHNPHSTKLKFSVSSNQTCLQCHAKKYDDSSHTFHSPGIVASACISCHMPAKLYMGNDLRHDHSFRIPRPDLSVKYGTPNACGTCHNNRTAQWAADAVSKWYGPVRKYHFADDLIEGSKMDANSEAHLIKLISDTTVPNIIKATAANYLGSIPTQKSLQTLISCLGNADAQTRYRALRSLDNFSPADWKSAVGPLLADKVRAVRIAAADLYTTIPDQEVPAEYTQVYASARNELQNYLLYQADFSVGNLMIADHYLKLKDFNNAEKFYLKGLKKDSMMNYARLNLSTVYNSLGKNDKALQELETAAKIDPKNERIYYNLALLHNELNDKPAAEKSFAKAVELKSSNPRLYYNYGLLLNEKRDFKGAAIILQKGIAISPSSPDLYYALTIVYMQAMDLAKAREVGMKLKQLDPNNPNYAQMFKQLGI
jgi:predicted CXXCH cytochrome family protein